jgi:hypothetical protein
LVAVEIRPSLKHDPGRRLVPLLNRGAEWRPVFTEVVRLVNLIPVGPAFHQQLDQPLVPPTPAVVQGRASVTVRVVHVRAVLDEQRRGVARVVATRAASDQRRVCLKVFYVDVDTEHAANYAGVGGLAVSRRKVQNLPKNVKRKVVVSTDDGGRGLHEELRCSLNNTVCPASERTLSKFGHLVRSSDAKANQLTPGRLSFGTIVS